MAKVIPMCTAVVSPEDYERASHWGVAPEDIVTEYCEKVRIGCPAESACRLAASLLVRATLETETGEVTTDFEAGRGVFVSCDNACIDPTRPMEVVERVVSGLAGLHKQLESVD